MLVIHIYKDWVNGIPSQSMAPDTQLLSKFVLFAHKMVLHLKAYCPEFWWCHVQYWQPSLALHRSLQAGQLTTSLVISPPTMPLVWILVFMSGHSRLSPKITIFCFQSWMFGKQKSSQWIFVLSTCVYIQINLLHKMMQRARNSVILSMVKCHSNGRPIIINFRRSIIHERFRIICQISS